MADLDSHLRLRAQHWPEAFADYEEALAVNVDQSVDSCLAALRVTTVTAAKP